MGYHPETLAFSFPPYPRGGASLRNHPKPWSMGRALYALKPWIGFDVWHIDPEKPAQGQRTDDSCGWFDRRPREYAEAVNELLRDTAAMHDIRLTLDRRKTVPMPFYEGISEPHTDPDTVQGYPRLTQADTLALVLMVARQLERTRWWRKRYPASWWKRPFIRERNVNEVAFDLALNPVDNLSSSDDAACLVRLIAGALHRHFKPWWKHPRWHVHHWQVNVDLARNLRRMFQPCATCGKRLGFGVSPGDPGDGTHHHMKCLGWEPAAKAEKPA